MSPLRSWVRRHPALWRQLGDLLSRLICLAFLVAAVGEHVSGHTADACYSLLWAIYFRLVLLGEVRP